MSFGIRRTTAVWMGPKNHEEFRSLFGRTTPGLDGDAFFVDSAAGVISDMRTRAHRRGHYLHGSSGGLADIDFTQVLTPVRISRRAGFRVGAG